MHKNNFIKKGFTIGIIIIFFIISVKPGIATIQKKEESNIELKNFLFQTIIDTAKNPEVKNLLEQYNHNLFPPDYNYRSVFSQLQLNKPRLLFNILFTKSSITFDYLDKCYNRGIEIINILGEDKAFEILESNKITDTEFLKKFNNIIIKDEILYNKIATLNEKNKEFKTGQYLNGYPIICRIIGIIDISIHLLFDYIGSIIYSLPGPFDIFVAIIGIFVGLLGIHISCISATFGC